MRGELITFSALERVEACPGSTVLRAVPVTTEAAIKGTVMHEFVMNVLKYGEVQALALAPAEHREMLAEYDLEGLPTEPGAYASEVAFAIDIAEGTARAI